MSSTTTTTAPPERRRRLDGLSVAAWSLPSRLMAFFSGTVGLAMKLAFLAVVNAIALWAAITLADQGKWPAVGVLAAATIALDAIYLMRRTLPLKFMVPGTIFLLSFQVIPILYNVNVAFTNWSTGHLLTKTEAIERIKRDSLAPPAEGKSYLMAPARDADGALVLLLIDEVDGRPFVGSEEGLEPLPAGSLEAPQGLIERAPEDYRLITGQELVGLDTELAALIVPTEGDNAIRAEGFEVAIELEPTLRYDAARDRFVGIQDDRVYRDNGRGSFVAPDGAEIEPGWRTNVGFSNFTQIFRNEQIRAPFVRVFVWTVVLASLTVLLSFALGLFLAMALDKPGMRLSRAYRTILILPWATPSVLTLLVWSGLLNDDFGVVNRVFHTDIPWLFDATWAKVSLILVSVWLTFPYFMLVSLGALRAIPPELIEAARVDGGGPWQVFRRITLPLLLVVMAPLLIASFAFNFNDFNKIYLLTGGGPADEQSSVAGATDILITYTYKLAFESGKGQDFGFASAISIVIFFIVAAISVTAFWRTKESIE